VASKKEGTTDNASTYLLSLQCHWKRLQARMPPTRQLAYSQNRSTTTILDQSGEDFDISAKFISEGTNSLPHQIKEAYIQVKKKFHNTPNTPNNATMCQHQVVIGACGHITYFFVERSCLQEQYSHCSARKMFPASHRVTTHTIRTPRYCHGCGPAPSQKRHDHGKCTVNKLSASMSSLSLVPRR